MYNNPLYYRNQRPIQIDLQVRGQIAWWPMLASWGARVLWERGGRKNNGSFPGGAANPTWVTDDERGVALSFDGGDNVSVPLTVSVADLNRYTIAVWFKTTFSGTQPIYSESLTTNNFPIVGLDMGDAGAGTVRGYHRGSANPFVNVESGTGFHDGEWHLACWIRRASDSFEFFVDGVSIGTTAVTPLSGTYNRINIGFRERISSDRFDGQIGDVFISSRALSAAAVRKMAHPMTMWGLYRPLPRQSYLAPAVAAGFPWPSKNRHPSTNVLLRL